MKKKAGRPKKEVVKSDEELKPKVEKVDKSILSLAKKKRIYLHDLFEEDDDY